MKVMLINPLTRFVTKDIMPPLGLGWLAAVLEQNQISVSIIDALAEGIRKVLGDGELGNKLAENAYKGVQLYTWGKRAERILEFVGEKCRSGKSSSTNASRK